jgi:DNA-binding transcriptional regulator PaaX
MTFRAEPVSPRVPDWWQEFFFSRQRSLRADIRRVLMESGGGRLTSQGMFTRVGPFLFKEFTHAVTAMVEDGQLVPEDRGLYRLSEATHAVSVHDR